MQEGNRLFRRFDQLAVAVDNIQHLAPAGRLDLPFEAAKCRRARVIPADVDHYMALRSVEDRKNLRVDLRSIDGCARTVRADNSDALLFEHFFIICRAKVGVDNVEIRYRDLLPFPSQGKRQIQRKVGFATAVVPANDMNAVFDPDLPLMNNY